MKSDMSAFDIYAMVGEMQGLVGGYLDKVFHWDRRNALLRINLPGEGRRELLLLDLKWLFLSKERPETPDTPSQFAVWARKTLPNARITAVKQQEFDRIVTLEVATKEKSIEIVIELFGDGNLLFVSEGKIINCLFSKTWKHRDVRPGADYSYPPPRFNPVKEGYEGFKKALASSSSDVVRTLATSVNLGGQYGEELCVRTSIDKNRKAKELQEEEMLALHNELRALLAALREAPQPSVVMQNGTPLDVSPIRLKQHGVLEIKEFASFSEAVAFFVENSAKEKERVENPEIGRLARQMEQQRATAEKLREDAVQLTRQAESIYAHYQQVLGILQVLKKQLLGQDWEAARRTAKELGYVAQLEPQDNKALVLIEGDKLWLDYSASIEENANMHYSRAKEAKEKLTRAEDALHANELKISELKERQAKEYLVQKATVKKTKAFWFEAYKWFITSGGHLVLAGRDARLNDQVVKKHLTSADRYAHADVHGAPSVIVKEGGTANEQELREACIFALAHSKAWNAGIREGSAYWVLPDQVSKMAEAGEFVPRGAFVIRGKRNYEHHVLLELAIGEIEHEGTRKIMCAPRTALEPRSGKYVVITPGERERSKVSAALAREFNVPEEEISRILPPGTIEIALRKGMEENK